MRIRNYDSSDLIGKEATIKTGIHKGDWGIIKFYDGEYYHIAIFGDKNDCPVFTRDEIKIKRD